MELERKVYSCWAFQSDGIEKSKINREIYNEIKDKAEVELLRSGYGHKIYKIVSNPEDLSLDELALICDEGNLCFGYSNRSGGIAIHTD